MKAFDCSVLSLVFLSASSLMGGHEASATVHYSCKREVTLRRYLCMVLNWTAAHLGPEQRNGILINITVPSNEYRVDIKADCSGKFAQTFSPVTRDAYDKCNSTLSPDGKRYTYGNSDTEVNIPICLHNTVNHLSLDSRAYTGLLREELYVIGVLNSSSINVTNQVLRGLQDRVGGDCLLGLRLRVIVNWRNPTTTTPPPTTEPDPLAAQGASNAVRPSCLVILLVVALSLRFLFY